MTSLQDSVRITRRFQRSIRIDTDIHDLEALDGFKCPASSGAVLAAMAQHIEATGAGAFTWTGPYGSGKSSLVLALCAALAGKAKLRDAAAEALSRPLVESLTSALPPNSQGWHIVPVVGRRAALAQVIGDALESAGLAKHSAKGWSDDAVLTRISAIAKDSARTHGGLLLIIDEMGKILEGAANDAHDIYLLQQMAEQASRSNRRLIVIGILHQAFDEYAQRLARDVRDEWAKIQGRFVDLVINASGDEQLELLARALDITGKPPLPLDAIDTVTAVARADKPAAQKTLSSLLRRCWPLHPVVACLLGPLSRRRFGQNQRSLFAFLNSAEPSGFHDFLADAGKGDLYVPARLWDYLRINLEPSILASPDGHRWSIGIDALDRCIAAGGGPLEQDLLKTVILIDLFRERSGLQATPDLLRCSVAGASKRDIDAAFRSLVERSCIILRRHLGAYALYAGSDFDIDDAVRVAMPAHDALDLAKLRQLGGLQPLLAKRHYHETGAIRWFNLELVGLHNLSSALADKQKAHGPAGRFILAIPTDGTTLPKAKRLCANLAQAARPNIIIGISDHAWHVVELARELTALSSIHDERPELRGDVVARREVLARLSSTRARLELELQRMLDGAAWHRAGAEPSHYTASALNALASDISDDLYNKAPRILNELLNRDFPSSNAVKAQRDLMKVMLTSAGVERLGLNGWPAEAGLMESILLRTCLYQHSRAGWRFVRPADKNDPARLGPAWSAALKELKSRHNTPVSIADLFDLWRSPPFGLKEGLMPILVLALYIVNRDRLAVYRQGSFQPELSDLDVDLVTSDPAHLQLRWIEFTDDAKEILSGLKSLAVRLDPKTHADTGAPLDVARSLVAAFEGLPPWTRRSSTHSARVHKLVAMLRYASDPNRLLFDDMPGLSEGNAKTKQRNRDTVELISSAYDELTAAYPSLLEQLEKLLMEEVEASAQKLTSLHARAGNVLPAVSDLRLKAFVQRLGHYRNTSDMEGIVSLAIEKKAGDWTDTDIIDAKRRIAELAQQFKHHEEIARVAGRPDGRHRMSVIVPRDGVPRAMHSEFVVNAHDSPDVDDLITKLDAALKRSSKIRQEVILAALAELSARYMSPSRSLSTSRRRAI